MKNEILLRRKSKVSVNYGNSPESHDDYIATILKNVESLGFTFSSILIERLQTLTKKELQEFYLDIVPKLKNLIGADVEYNPMYPNFPKSVMAADEAELYLNAIIHYLSGGTLYPSEAKEERLPLFENTDIKVIDLGSEEDLQEIFNNLCHSKTSISKTDKEDLEWIFKNVAVSFPEEIPLKENVALIGKIYIENCPHAEIKDIQKYFKTATDVLRLITAMSNGDIGLATNTKYRNFSRPERRMILDLLQNCGSITEDMYRYKNRWIRIAEKIHPGEFNKDKYKKVISAFSFMHEKKIPTFSSRVESAISDKDYNTALGLLKNRPGELARRLDELLRNSGNPTDVVNTFKTVAANVSTPVLLQVKTHFMHRNDELKTRVFFPKGELARSYNVPNTLPNIEEKYCKAVVNICDNALIANYTQKEFLGNVYLSDEFKNYVIPFSQRSASKTTKPVTRGSRFKLNENANTLRSFIWWTNTDNKKNNGWYDDDGRVDIDLSAAIFDENWNYMEHVSYTNLRSEKYKAVHSGDITNGGPLDGEGVSEFLDVDIDSVLKYGARYVVFQVYNYTGQKYCDIPNAMFGWMEREEAGSGEIYEPKTVKQKMDLTTAGTVAIPVIFDCETKEIIWCDMNISLTGCYTHRGGNNLESNLSTVAATCYSVVNMHKPSMYDLIELHAKARGVLVENKEEADIVFDIEKDASEDAVKTVTPYDLDEIMGEYL